jgi:peptide chain release factor 2
MAPGRARPVTLILVAGPEYDTEIKQLTATMHTIEQVLDLPAMKREIDDLGVQVAAPDLWDDQANATRVTGRLSALQGEVERFEALQGRIDDLGVMVELAEEEGDADSLAESEIELGKIKKAVEALDRERAAWTPPTSPRC